MDWAAGHRPPLNLEGGDAAAPRRLNSLPAPARPPLKGTAMTTRLSPSRRAVLKGVGALAALTLAPATLRAQGEPLRLGILTPLTGAGSADGPRMLAAMQAVAKEVNAAGRVPRPPI